MSFVGRRPTVWVLALSAATAMPLSGCTGSTAGSAAKPNPTITTGSSLIASAQQHPLTKLTSVPPGSLGSTWTLLATSQEGHRLALSADGISGCASLIGVFVAESATSVTISPRVQPSAGGATCTKSPLAVLGYIDLDAPVGNRALSQGLDQS